MTWRERFHQWREELRYNRAFRRAMRTKHTLPDEPEDCPACNARIERDGDLWRCAGLVDRAEIETYLGANTPPSILFRPPCGWSGATELYKVRWA